MLRNFLCIISLLAGFLNIISGEIFFSIMAEVDRVTNIVQSIQLLLKINVLPQKKASLCTDCVQSFLPVCFTYKHCIFHFIQTKLVRKNPLFLVPTFNVRNINHKALTFNRTRIKVQFCKDLNIPIVLFSSRAILYTFDSFYYIPYIVI